MLQSDLTALPDGSGFSWTLVAPANLWSAQVLKVRGDLANDFEVKAVLADCMAQRVVIGATNRSMPGRNNVLLFAPPLIAAEADVDAITDAVDGALGRVFA